MESDREMCGDVGRCVGIRVPQTVASRNTVSCSN